VGLCGLLHIARETTRCQELYNELRKANKLAESVEFRA
jgi:hypothetical protein